jgi:hypothetical protein
MWRLQFKRLLLTTRYNHRHSDAFAALGDMPQMISAETACLMLELSGNAKSKQRFFTEWVRSISGKQILTGCQIHGTRLITSATYAENFVKLSYSPYASLNKLLTEKKEFGKWRFLERRNCPDTMFQTSAFAADILQNDSEFDPPLCVEHFLTNSDKEPEMNIFERLWKEIIDYPVIPFDLASRRSKLAKAYKILEPYIEAHKADKAKVG